jgi:hypothetical protein
LRITIKDSLFSHKMIIIPQICHVSCSHSSILTREPLQYSDMKCRHEKNMLWSVDNINVYMENFAQECNNFAICDLKLHFPLWEIDVKANYKIVNNQLKH